MISTALRAVADDVEARAATATEDAHREPTETERTAKANKIRAVARDLRALADAAETRSVRYAEFEAFKDRLYALGIAIPPRLVQDLGTAIRDVDGPVKAREKGWLKGPGRV